MERNGLSSPGPREENEVTKHRQLNGKFKMSLSRCRPIRQSWAPGGRDEELVQVHLCLGGRTQTFPNCSSCALVRRTSGLEILKDSPALSAIRKLTS